MSRGPNWCFTINNWTVEDKQKLDLLECGYVLYGEEVAPTTGTPHLQCYVEFTGKKTWNVVRALLPERSADIAIRRGTQKQAIEYCKKEGKFTERGEKKNQGSRGDLDGIRVLALEGGMREVTRHGNCQQIAVATKFLTYNEEPRDWKPYVVWIWGPTGVGKSRMAREILNSDDIYTKSDGTKWFDGYDNHENVIFDDFREDWFTFTYMLSLLDRYECRVEIKGGLRQFKPKVIVITSPCKPEYAFQNCYEDRTQLLRRIDEVIELVARCPEVAGNN